MNKEQKFLTNLLELAVRSVYQEERFLLEYSDGIRIGMEQSFVFRAGIYLDRLLQDTKYSNLDLDSEYNKNHGGIKATINFPRGLRPDLIIHKRDLNGITNKLVAEFKGDWRLNSAAGKRKIEKDIKKLKDLTDPNDAYQYSLGVFVLIGNEKPAFNYFINGRAI